MYLWSKLLLPRWKQDHSALRLWPGASWRPGTLRGLRRCRENSTKSNSWIWPVPERPCTSSYCDQVHAYGTQVSFYFWISFCWRPLPRGLRPGLILFSDPTFRIGVVQRTDCFFSDFLHPASRIFPWQFQGAHRTRRAP